MASSDLQKSLADLVNSYVELTLRAQSNVFAAVLSTLVGRNRLSPDKVRADILDSLKEVSIKSDYDLLRGDIDAFEAQLTKRLILLVQERLGTL